MGQWQEDAIQGMVCHEHVTRGQFKQSYGDSSKAGWWLYLYTGIQMAD